MPPKKIHKKKILISDDSDEEINSTRNNKSSTSLIKPNIMKPNAKKISHGKAKQLDEDSDGSKDDLLGSDGDNSDSDNLKENFDEIDDDDVLNDGREIEDEDDDQDDEVEESDDGGDEEVGNDGGDEDCLYRFSKKKTSLMDEDDIEDEFFFEEDAPLIDVFVTNDKRITKPTLTKYERVRVLSERAKQLSLNAKPMIKGVSNLDPKEIAQLELKMGVIPLIIIRTLPTGQKERWKVSELKISN